MASAPATGPVHISPAQWHNRVGHAPSSSDVDILLPTTNGVAPASAPDPSTVVAHASAAIQVLTGFVPLTNSPYVPPSNSPVSVFMPTPAGFHSTLRHSQYPQPPVTAALVGKTSYQVIENGERGREFKMNGNLSRFSFSSRTSTNPILLYSGTPNAANLQRGWDHVLSLESLLHYQGDPLSGSLTLDGRIIVLTPDEQRVVYRSLFPGPDKPLLCVKPYACEQTRFHFRALSDAAGDGSCVYSLVNLHDCYFQNPKRIAYGVPGIHSTLFSLLMGDIMFKAIDHEKGHEFHFLMKNCVQVEEMGHDNEMGPAYFNEWSHEIEVFTTNQYFLHLMHGQNDNFVKLEPSAYLRQVPDPIEDVRCEAFKSCNLNFYPMSMPPAFTMDTTTSRKKAKTHA